MGSLLLKNSPSAPFGQRIGEGFRIVVITLFLALFVLVALLPLLWMISASLKTEAEVFAYPFRWIGSELRWQNYLEVFRRIPFARYYLNTIFVATMVTTLQIVTCSLAAYVFSKITFPERNILFLAYIATMMIPYPVIMIPQFYIIRSLGLFDNLWSLVAIQSFSPFGVFLFRQYFLTIPGELSEAAIIDGAGHFEIYRRIILPLARPAVASLIIFSFTYNWNDFQAPLIFLATDPNKTLQLGIVTFTSIYNQSFALMMAAAVIAILPTIIVFFFAQKQFIEGISAGGLKY
jgi:multiple sugar transport system permease protein